MVDSPQQVAADTKEILNEAVHREKPLRVRGAFEPPHLSLAMPRGLMRNLRSIVFVLSVLWITDGIAVRCAAE
jgi:hypothetical protein